ncbi:unnamed protein product [Vitrella brassicaformis CCMP3155]|uniref:Mitochondrial import inner membrane translocase subunit n=1 Tax=Vitrella brassicaformis (strain CCMP3155) TaxID=1169540 RepID=A0A0G4EM87_VITBC|nr:unnamed protein product [Vitrella brassicaformis CCMP3155]|eukprot:CEL98057.1 unnamed protein product [Vitrella brassicaformis CCMP3155]
MNAPPNAEQIDPVMVAVTEMQGLADLFSRMQNVCWSKCIPNVREGILAMGEMSCVDRCVSKYFDVHKMVGEKLQEQMQKAQMQQPGATPS